MSVAIEKTGEPGSRLTCQRNSAEAAIPLNEALALSPSSSPLSPARAVCPLCPHACALTEERFGVCGARVARDGAVVADSYGKLTALALDPIEKKPLACFHPGSMILSVGSYGCNLTCPFCQNSDIARAHGGGNNGNRHSPALRLHTYTPTELVEIALSLKNRGNIGIAYTYNEPLINYEFVSDTAQLMRKAGMLNVIVTNGYINEEPLAALLPHLDAANIDLKGFTQTFYDRLGAPRGLATAKRSIELAARAIHVEVTTLIIPGLNDSTDEIEQLAAWLADVNPQIPLHLTRFHPAYRMLNVTPTPRDTIYTLARIASRHLQTVLSGNM
jgi:pyruvate formate lyase activating enzyme